MSACVEGENGCKKCRKNGLCKTCDIGYYFNKGTCKECPHGCAVCLDSGYCIEAKPGFFVNRNQGLGDNKKPEDKPKEDQQPKAEQVDL